MLSIDGMGLGLNWQRFLSQTLDPDLAPKPPRNTDGTSNDGPNNGPAETGSTKTLSDKLEQTDGVIRPPANISPDNTVRPPVPNPGTTPVIPPPGSPGGNQQVEPK